MKQKVVFVIEPHPPPQPFLANPWWNSVWRVKYTASLFDKNTIFFVFWLPIPHTMLNAFIKPVSYCSLVPIQLVHLNHTGQNWRRKICSEPREDYTTQRFKLFEKRWDESRWFLKYFLHWIQCRFPFFNHMSQFRVPNDLSFHMSRFRFAFCSFSLWELQPFRTRNLDIRSKHVKRHLNLAWKILLESSTLILAFFWPLCSDYYWNDHTYIIMITQVTQNT